MVAKYRLNLYGMHSDGKLKLRAYNTSYCLIEVVTKAGLIDSYNCKYQPIGHCLFIVVSIANRLLVRSFLGVTTLSTIHQFYWWWKPEYPEKTTDLSQVTDKELIKHLWLVYGVQRHLQQCFSYIVAVSFIGGGNRNTKRKPPSCRYSLPSFIT